MGAEQVIYRGGPDTERLYRRSADFTLADGTRVVVAESKMPAAVAGMVDVTVRSLARYGLVALFCRPGRRVLDLPCGAGYSSELLMHFSVDYEGVDIDVPTVEYARRVYGGPRASFRVGDMRAPDLGEGKYDIIGLIEGIEHIDQQYQAPLIAACEDALAEGGVLVVSSPEPVSGISGPSAHNPDHLWELNRDDFAGLLNDVFGQENVEILSQRGILLSTGVTTTCLYGVCHRA